MYANDLATTGVESELASGIWHGRGEVCNDKSYFPVPGKVSRVAWANATGGW